ncbi:MAG TPA: transposase [Burkholderiaceae bacterium]|nr:transposase [Burkholderiaceae bacterium]
MLCVLDKSKRQNTRRQARERDAAAGLVTRVLRMRIKDKHAPWLRERGTAVNLVWNFCNETSFRILQREQRFVSAYELDALTAGATKEGLQLHSQTVQAVAGEYVTRRKQFKKARLRWRVFDPKRSSYSLGWVPFKKSAIAYRNGQVFLAGHPLSLWDSYGLADYELGAGNLSEDARGRWYLNVAVKVKKQPRAAANLSGSALGIDLGLKELAAGSDGLKVQAQRFYRDLEPKLAIAQRAGKKARVRALHAKIANRRKDHLHKLSTSLVRQHAAIFVGDVNAAGLARTSMAKSVLDAGWSSFRTMLQYKCDDAGVWFKEVNEAHSTPDCHLCRARTGPKGREELGVRRWTCAGCGTAHDRDTNASCNIRARGLEWLEKMFAEAAKARACETVTNKAATLPRPDMVVS